MTKKFYELTRKDIKKSGIVLAKAFSEDPIWKAVFKDVEFERQAAFFESPVRYGIKYGRAIAPTSDIEGIAVLLPGKHAKMTPIKLLLSGAAFSGARVGMGLLNQMDRIFSCLDEDKEKNTEGLQYNYLQVIGVAPEHQGKGFGTGMLEALLCESDSLGVHVYLETGTEKNVGIYERRGFEVIGKVMHPIINLPQWEMLRKPK